jgi:hypothetical protein
MKTSFLSVGPTLAFLFQAPGRFAQKMQSYDREGASKDAGRDEERFP